MPVTCGTSWRAATYSGHASNAIDLNWGTGSDNYGLPVLASAAGTAYRKTNPGGYGNYVDVDHGGGWVTRYAHLSAYSVPDGTAVASGQQLAAAS
jgi:murein DD-endopeptidase MepM/ murein hydrolase activator NlpD